MTSAESMAKGGSDFSAGVRDRTLYERTDQVGFYYRAGWQSARRKAVDEWVPPGGRDQKPSVAPSRPPVQAAPVVAPPPAQDTPAPSKPARRKEKAKDADQLTFF